MIAGEASIVNHFSINNCLSHHQQRAFSFVMPLPSLFYHSVLSDNSCCACSALQIEIFPGSGIMCDRLNWSKAKHSTKASTFARTFLVGVFDQSKLLTSSLKEGSSKRDANAALIGMQH